MNMAAKRKNADLWRSGIVAYTIDGDVAVPGLINEAIHSLNEPFALTSRHIECRSNARQLTGYPTTDADDETVAGVKVRQGQL
jgi:hypothetical protein